MAGETPRFPKLNACEVVIPLQTGYHSATPNRVTPQHHRPYTHPMAHASDGCWGVRGSLGEACPCLFKGGYKKT
jgi:hypothetical protein